MSLAAATAAVLALAVALAWARLVLWQHQAPRDVRSPRWRLALLLTLQPLCAALLYLTLFPPPVASPAGTLVVATAHAPQAGARVALPEAPPLPGVERVPDLATALRRYPATRRVLVAGDGLEARDRAALGGRALAFAPAAEPRGLVRLDLPLRVAAGAAFRVGGRVNGGGSVELIDPAGQRVDAAVLPPSGEFVLGGTARAAGLARFRLRIRDTQRRVIEDADVPLSTAADPAPRLLLLAGAPSPDVKYLRRWASDAGLSLNTQLNVGGGLGLGDPPVPLTAATLARFDLAILDEQSWAALAPGERAAMADAVRGGLGLLLRTTGPVSEATRRDWRRFGLAVSAGTATAPLRLADRTVDAEARRARRGIGTRDAPSAGNDAEVPVLARRAVTVAADAAAPLLRDAAGTVVASWRAEGRGRVAIWPVTDSFTLVLAGHADRHAELWSGAAAALARADTAPEPRIAPLPRAQRRVAICGLPGPARVVAPDGATSLLRIDPATGAAACAGYWPRQPGWHLLRIAAVADRSWPFFAFPENAIPGVRAAETRAATLRLVGAPVAARAPDPAAAARGPAWPWFVAWLVASAALWWFERFRRAALLSR